MRYPRSFARNASSVLIGAGLLLVLYAGAWEVGLAPGSRVTIPEPVALTRSRPTAIPAEAPPAEPQTDRTPSPGREGAGEGGRGEPQKPRSSPQKEGSADTPAATAPVAPPSAAPLTKSASTDLGLRKEDEIVWRDIFDGRRPPSAADRLDDILAAHLPVPARAVRLVIPAIKLQTEVQQAGVKPNAHGEPEWVTLPFIAVHYGDLTALVGAPGNAVIAGHVVTLNEGNVFRNLYQVDLGDEIQVSDDLDQVQRFEVVRVKLVPPSDISVMEPTPDRTLTLITCGGTFDPRTREFSERLIVIAKPLPLP